MDIRRCLLPWIIVILPYLFYKSNELNIINTHEHVAKGLGVKVGKRTYGVILC